MSEVASTLGSGERAAGPWEIVSMADLVQRLHAAGDARAAVGASLPMTTTAGEQQCGSIPSRPMSRHPAAWSPPTVMPALGEGEAVRSWPVEVWGAPAVHPPASAPGFQAAGRLGLLPPPPPLVAPSPVPGLSSWDRMRLALLLGLGVFALMIPVGNALDAGAWSALLAGAPFCVGAWLLYSTTARDETEFAAGYTSGRAHTGLWRLGRDGRVLRRPDRTVPPPGWYPSPYYPGLLQRWDGPGWKPLPQRWWRHEHLYFRVPDRPFL